MGSTGESHASGTVRRRIALAALFLVVLAASIVTGAGLWIRHIRMVRHPLYLIIHGSYFERLQAAADLGVLREDTDIDRVMAALLGAIDDGEIVLRSASEEALGSLLAQSLGRPGKGTAADGEQDRRRLVLAIRKLNEGLSDPEASIRASAANGLGFIGKAAAFDLPPELARALADESPIVRQAATKALKDSQHSASVVPALKSVLASPDQRSRFLATEILARAGPAAKSAIPDLLALLSEPFDLNRKKTDGTSPMYWDPACGAAIALGEIGPDPDSIAGLIALLASDVSERASSAASGLAKLGPDAGIAVPALITTYRRVLESEGRFLGQSAVAMALGQLGPQSTAAAESIAILTKGLDSNDTWVRIAAAMALGKFGPDAAAAVPKLRDLERSPIPDLQNAAMKALEAIEPETTTSAGSSSVQPKS